MSKTVEISRELLQKVDDLLYIMIGHDSYPRLVHKYGNEWWTPINEMRAEICTIIAAPAVERQEPVAVVVPERAPESTIPETDDPDCNYEAGLLYGWNACLDKFNELNQSRTIHLDDLDPAQRLALARGEGHER